MSAGQRINGSLTKPQSCCRPCSKQAIVKALLFPPIRNSSVKALCIRLNHVTDLPGTKARFCLLAASSSSISLSIARSTFSTIEMAPPYTLLSTTRASCVSPFLTSHLGVSGRKIKSTNCRAAGAAPRPTIHLHPWGFDDNIHPAVYATTWPNVTKRILKVTKPPRKVDGESSEIYSGTTKLALPTARPTILLPPIIPHTLVAIACHRAPMMKRTSATTITPFRPSLSARMPARGLAMRANRLVHEVMRLLSRFVNGRERSGPIDTRVEEITPVLPS